MILQILLKNWLQYIHTHLHWQKSIQTCFILTKFSYIILVRQQYFTWKLNLIPVWWNWTQTHNTNITAVNTTQLQYYHIRPDNSVNWNLQWNMYAGSKLTGHTTTNNPQYKPVTLINHGPDPCTDTHIIFPPVLMDGIHTPVQLNLTS